MDGPLSGQKMYLGAEAIFRVKNVLKLNSGTPRIETWGRFLVYRELSAILDAPTFSHLFEAK
jgi:hypothetical protein